MGLDNLWSPSCIDIGSDFVYTICNKLIPNWFVSGEKASPECQAVQGGDRFELAGLNLSAGGTGRHYHIIRLQFQDIRNNPVHTDNYIAIPGPLQTLDASGMTSAGAIVQREAAPAAALTSIADREMIVRLGLPPIVRQFVFCKLQCSGLAQAAEQ